MRRLSERSGVAVETISRIERGESKPQARTLSKLAAALGVSPVELTTPVMLPTTRQEEDKPMTERTIRVPRCYPDMEDPNSLKAWDGSEDAWMWISALDFREDAMTTAAAHFYSRIQDWSAVAELLETAGWESHGDAEEFVDDHREAIVQRANELMGR